MTANERRIKSLQDQGFGVTVKQLRLTTETLALALRNPEERGLVKSLARSRHELNETGQTPVGHGGVTIVVINTPSGDEVHAEAICNPKDHFSKSLGLTIALGRAETLLS